MPNAISVVQKSRKATYGAVGAPLSWSKLLNVIEAAADAIIAVDGDQRIVVCNRAAVSMFGYTRSEMVDQPFSLLLPERTHAEYWAYLNQEQQVHRAETIIGTPSIVRCKRKSGAEFDAEVARNLGDKRTRSGSTIILRDVTSRDTAERLDAHHRTIVSTLAEAVISIDAKGCIETWNESAEKITGYLKSEVIGQAIENVALFSPCPIAMARGTGSPQRIEGPLTAKSGKTVEVAVTATPMFTPQQRFLGVSAIITDISLRRQLCNDGAIPSGKELDGRCCVNGSMYGWDMRYNRRLRAEILIARPKFSSLTRPSLARTMGWSIAEATCSNPAQVVYFAISASDHSRRS
jgi:PAS domain S-box-containing protein